MKILIEQSGYPLLNLGDLAMLQVAIDRLSHLGANPSIQVCTTAPNRLAYYCPATQPLLPNGRWIWFSPLVGRAHQLPSRRAVQLWSELEEKCRRQAPGLVHSFLKLKLKRYPQAQVEQFEAFMAAVSEADLVIASGGGYITDVFKSHAVNVLNTLDIAICLGKPVAILGQGLGPLRDPELQAKAKSVLSKLKLISLREKRAGVPLLQSLEIPADRFTVTGDDAIEMAYTARNPAAGSGIGVNLRVASYADIHPAAVETVRAALQFAAKSLAVPLIPAPISLKAQGEELSDSMAICKLLEEDPSDGGRNLDTPLKVIQQIGQCAVVVTGSYHAGVFALAQGIPVIGLAQSEYYADKFLGLADQFGAGCEVAFLNDPDLKENLSRQIVRLWEKSEFFRPQLLEAADRQIQASRFAYSRVMELASR